jgi:zinc-binding alcohol dehydrogenase/oxidoreductase
MAVTGELPGVGEARSEWYSNTPGSGPLIYIRSVRAARLAAFGEVPRFEVQEIPDPAPGPGEAVVDLRAAALNRRDWWIYRKPGYCAVPVTLGSDGAGVVSAVGPGVTGWAVGDEVVINPTLGWTRGYDVPGPEFDILGAPSQGTFAEKVVIAAANLAMRPQRLSWEEAAAVNLAGLTAWRATVTCAQAGPGRSVLIAGAGGGVATFAIQIAAARGAAVYVTSSSSEKIERAMAVGARAGFRYDDPDWPQQACSAVPGGLDAAIDSYGGPSWAHVLKALRRGGVLVNFGDTGGDQSTIDVADIYWEWRSIVGTTMGSPQEYDAMLDHVRTASWRPVIDSVYQLENLAEAAARLDGSTDRFGKIVIAIDQR